MKNHSVPALYVHCGFPKTGTTALQGALRASEEVLRQEGFLYPYAGSLDRPGMKSPNLSFNAHRNIAWELTRSRFFDSIHGNIDDLRKEISGFSGNIIVSSEDLESVLPCPDNLFPLLRVGMETGRKVILIVYLRNQVSYLESIYQELLKAGNREEYNRIVSLVMKYSSIAFKEYHYQFDYDNVLGYWKNIPNVKVIVRNYHVLTGGSIITDFAKILGLEGVLHPRAGEERANVREGNYDSLYRFYANRISREPTRIEKLRIGYLAHKAPRLTSSAVTQHKIVERFQVSNLRLCETWGIPTTGLDMKDVPRPSSEVTLEQFFSFEAQCAIRSGAVPDTRFSATEAKQTVWMAGVEKADANVPTSQTIRYWIGRARRYRRWYTSRIMNLILRDTSSEFE